MQTASNTGVSSPTMILITGDDFAAIQPVRAVAEGLGFTVLHAHTTENIVEDILLNDVTLVVAGENSHPFDAWEVGSPRCVGRQPLRRVGRWFPWTCGARFPRCRGGRPLRRVGSRLPSMRGTPTPRDA